MLDGFIARSEAESAKFVAAGYWENRTIAEMVYATASRHPQKPALIEGEKTVSYDKLCTMVERLAYRLLRAGIANQDRVVMQLPNSVEFVIAYLALTRIGAIPVMALRAHRETEIRHFASASGAVGYMIPDQFQRFDYRSLAQTVMQQCPSLKKVLVLGEPAAGQLSLRRMIDEDVPTSEVAAALASVRPDPLDVATMLLSGGTTALSKLIPRTHNDYVLNARLCGKAAAFDEHTVLMLLLPMGHNYNLAAPGMLGAFYYGGTVVVGPAADAEVVFPLVEKHRVTVIPAAVPLITNWLNSPVAAKHDLSSLRVIQNGGARLAPELRRRMREQFGCTPQEVYGTAEGLINMTRLDDPDDLLLESSGAPVCDADEIKVIDDQGNEVPDGQPGELITRGPYTIKGYYNAAQKNKEAFTADGFYRMGDIVRKRGRYVFAEGRTKDLINRGGEKISCEEVENLILKHPSVHQVALVAMPDPVFGEKACAFVALKPGQKLSFEELIAFLKQQNIASFKLPERLELIEQFPTSLVGKILKQKLREMIVAKLADVPSATN
ncbi:MAG TPA: AMP-binding protein [Burkholderiaceae bacterium]|nr:AMP-binding protein [Burkholderiaceae bacterium]